MDNTVIPVVVKGVMPTSSGCAVFLGNKDKTFVVYMDQVIGSTIQRAVNDEMLQRPMTHDLINNLLLGLGAQVERSIINDVKDGTFFARLIISMKNELGEKIVEIDARPSDSIVLALSNKKPLYVTENVLSKVDDMTEILEKILKEKGLP